jgi:hypothetical protein
MNARAVVSHDGLLQQLSTEASLVVAATADVLTT